jgi:hypothetical protein
LSSFVHRMPPEFGGRWSTTGEAQHFLLNCDDDLSLFQEVVGETCGQNSVRSAETITSTARSVVRSG